MFMAGWKPAPRENQANCFDPNAKMQAWSVFSACFGYAKTCYFCKMDVLAAKTAAFAEKLRRLKEWSQ
jgi:hypothetical protein